jgi:hypothetical protein
MAAKPMARAKEYHAEVQNRFPVERYHIGYAMAEDYLKHGWRVVGTVRGEMAVRMRVQGKAGLRYLDPLGRTVP